MDNGQVQIILEGGPGDLPETARLRREPTESAVIKVPHRGGYEHFTREPDDDPDRPAPAVYRWTMRTNVAE